MAILVVIGVMDLLAMAVVAAAITVERLAPAGERVPRATGAVAVRGRVVADRTSRRARMTRRITLGITLPTTPPPDSP